MTFEEAAILADLIAACVDRNGQRIAPDAQSLDAAYAWLLNAGYDFDKLIGPECAA